MFSTFVNDWRTIVPHVRARLLTQRLPSPLVWETRVQDPDLGSLPLSGNLRRVPGANELVILIHGLRDSPQSLEVLRGAAYFAKQGISSLALSLRGSDRLGEDFYNVGLTADLFAALESREVAEHQRVYLTGLFHGWLRRPARCAPEQKPAP